MIARIVLVLAATLSVLGSWWTYQQFDLRWKATKEFRGFVSSAPIEIRHLLIAPRDVRISAWQHGAFAKYRIKDNQRETEITYGVAMDARTSPARKWLVTSGVLSLYGLDSPVYRSVSEENVRLDSESTAYYLVRHSFPVQAQRRFLSQWNVDIEWFNETNLELLDCTVQTTRALAYLISPDGKKHPLLEFWANPSVQPLGIVRARWRDQIMELTQYGRNDTNTVPNGILESEGHSPSLANACSRCHANSMGGAGVVLESPYFLTGDRVRLGEASYHLLPRSVHSNEFNMVVSALGAPGYHRMSIQSSRGSVTAHLPGREGLAIKVNPVLIARGDLQLASENKRVGIYFGDVR